MRENSAIPESPQQIPHLSVATPPGFAAPYDWQPGRIVSEDETRAWRCLDGHPRAITDHDASVRLWAIQYEDDSLDDPGIEVFTGDIHLNSDQARELASALLEAAAELDGLVAR